MRGNATSAARERLLARVVEGGLTKKIWSILEKDLASSLKSLGSAPPGVGVTFLEWAGRADEVFFSLQAARHWPQSTVLSVRWNASSLAQAASLRSGLGLRNLLLANGGPATQSASSPASLSAALLSTLHAALPEPCTFQLLWDLPSAVATEKQLPHEFEQTLGSTLALCRTTYLSAQLPRDRFFEYWSSVKSLVEASAARVGYVVEHKALEGDYSTAASMSSAPCGK